jgi:CheY-like chemotaxis protein
MPVMDGYSATRELRTHPEWKHLPVIAMTASALAEDREQALASGMNAHITKPIHVESMLRTMAQWISGPGATAEETAEPTAGARADITSLDRAAGMAFCMGNDELYRRLLEGFRESESRFVDDIEAALTDLRWPDALRRAHDMKGLAGTIGARRLLEASQVLHTALTDRAPTRSRFALSRVGVELGQVLAEIDQIAPRSGSAPRLPG